MISRSRSVAGRFWRFSSQHRFLPWPLWGCPPSLVRKAHPGHLPDATHRRQYALIDKAILREKWSSRQSRNAHPGRDIHPEHEPDPSSPRSHRVTSTSSHASTSARSSTTTVTKTTRGTSRPRRPTRSSKLPQRSHWHLITVFVSPSMSPASSR